MHKTPLVSIIIPNYNHALYLNTRIDSVINQTFQNFELIILDDCSIDSSLEIIEKYRDNSKVTHIIYNEENSRSVFKQWVKGIENAKGKYIWIAESDDYAAENFLEETVKVLEQDASLGMVFTNTNTVNSQSEFLETAAKSKAESFDVLATFENKIHKDNVSQFLVSQMIIANASGVLFTKSSLMALDFQELQKYVNTGDRFVYIGIALEAKIYYIPKALNFMRLHENNTTKKNFKNGTIHSDRLRVLNYYFDQLCNNLQNRNYAVAFYKGNYLSFIHYGDYIDNIELLKKLKNKNEITTSFHYLVSFNLFLFKKIAVRSKILKGLFYRILVRQKFTCCVLA